MKILKSRLIKRVIVFGFSLMVVTAAFLIINHKFYVAGTVTNPLLIDNKFCSDPASPDQTGCTSFISSALAQSMSSPYQTVSGSVSIDGNVGIGTASPSQKLDVAGNIKMSGRRSVIFTQGDNSTTHVGGIQFLTFDNGVDNVWTPTDQNGNPINSNIRLGGFGSFNSNTVNLLVSGNAGIGTANPGAKLAVDASGVSIGIFIGSGGTNAYGASLLQINAPAGYGNWIFEIGKNGSSIFHIDANGNEYAVTNNQTSDRRLKTNITPLAENNGLSAINQLKPVTFNWLNQDYARTMQIGLIAQDVEKVFPQLVSESGTTTIQLADGTSQTVTETKNLNYSGLIPPLVKAIQELDARTQYIQNEGDNLISNIATFGKLIAGKIQAGVIEAEQVIINGVDILEKLNSLSQKIEAQQKEIDLLKQEIETLKAR